MCAECCVRARGRLQSARRRVPMASWLRVCVGMMRAHGGNLLCAIIRIAPLLELNSTQLGADLGTDLRIAPISIPCSSQRGYAFRAPSWIAPTSFHHGAHLGTLFGAAFIAPRLADGGALL